ncbi:HpcH/HpaI aldolase/citrate lyase family protein [bacterium]|jgi:citrate lyase subunit beta / citryl-CoA lyase|nr:HpcH/HpaI aldolase/citrate lyase family protein [bacterium]MBT3581894.1 HpcH/HpaI aldolase/citrate lyase family protein [bacterium]MBT4552712.1 HpcH/HpaI aldolase/citrate lyase family protein [bacterium]MBT7087603.1 HpcH/HpaI aldolase/citrate lyase family protein [bacterium]
MKQNKLRRTMLYIPGNNPNMIQNGGVYGADGIMLDLEDAVAISRKKDARILVRNMLQTMDFYGAEITVRINGLQTEFALLDMEAIVPCKPDALRIPKVETMGDIQTADQIISKIEKKHKIPQGTVKIHAMVETALGVENAFQIAQASPRVVVLTIGGQDLTADMGVKKTLNGQEIAYARQRIVMAAKAAKVAALDTIFADVDDEAGLIKETEMIKELGFDGKAVINPRQINLVHTVFTPKAAEIEKATRIVKAFKKAQKDGIGVFAIDGKMIDAPVVARAQRVLDLAGEKK